MIREKLLAVLPGQFTEEVPGDDPKESDEHQYCVQDTDTGEIAERSEMRNSLFLWRIINMYRNVFNGNASPGSKDKCFQLKFVFGGVIPLVHIHSLDGVQAVAGLSILQFDTCFEGKPEVGKLIGISREGARKSLVKAFKKIRDNKDLKDYFYAFLEFKNIPGISHSNYHILTQRLIWDYLYPEMEIRFCTNRGKPFEFLEEEYYKVKDMITNIVSGPDFFNSDNERIKSFLTKIDK